MGDRPRRLEVARSAVRDVQGAVAYYEEHAPHVVPRFEEQVRDAFQRALEGPLHYAQYEGETRRTLVRSFPYGVVYLVGDDVVQVVAFVALRRRPGYWKP